MKFECAETRRRKVWSVERCRQRVSTRQRQPSRVPARFTAASLKSIFNSVSLYSSIFNPLPSLFRPILSWRAFHHHCSFILSFACPADAVRHLIASLICPRCPQTHSLSSPLSLYDLRQTPLFADTKRTGARNTNVTSPEQPRNNAFTIIGHPRPMTCCAADPLARLLNISPSSQMRSSTRMALLCLLTASELLPQHV